MRAALLGGIFLVALAAAPYLAHAQESVAVEGRLRNGTAGEELPPNPGGRPQRIQPGR